MGRKRVEAVVAVATGKGAYSMPDAAEYLGISVRSLYDWLKLPGGPRSFTLGTRRLISKAELDAFIARRTGADGASA